MENYLRDIQDIRKMMDRSTQFLSLSGLAGVMAGVYALAGAYAAKKVYDLNHGRYITPESSSFKAILCIAIVVLVLSVLTAYILTARKARKQGETVWNSTSKRLAVNFLIPLVTGGIFALILLKKRLCRPDRPGNAYILRACLHKCQQIHDEAGTLPRADDHHYWFGSCEL